MDWCGDGVARDAGVNQENDYRMVEAMFLLRDRGYSILAVILRLSPSFLGLDIVSIFSPEDISIFLNQLEDFLIFVVFLVVPNRLLLNANLFRLPWGTKIESLLGHASLLLRVMAVAVF